MKVIVLTPNYPRKEAMNNGIFIHQQVKALRALGVDCHVLLTHNWFPPFGLHRLHPYWRLGYKQKRSYLTNYEGVPIHHVPVFVKMPSRFFHEDHYEREAWAIIKYIKHTQLLHSAEWLYANFLTDYGYIGALVKKSLGIKLAAIARGDDVHAWPENDPALIKNLRIVCREADLLLANSKRLSEDVRFWFEPGFDRYVSVIYNGVDTERFKPVKDDFEKLKLQKKFGLPEGYKFLLCVATPVVLKGWIELLDAIKLLGDDFIGWKLVAVTTPRNSNDALDLNHESKKRGIEEHVVWLGYVSPVDMPDCYRAMDAFILPSYNEGMSNAVLEALASCLPVITTDVGGHKEVMEENQHECIIQPRSVSSIVKSLLRLISRTKSSNIIAGAPVSSFKEKIGSYTMNAQSLLDLFKGLN